MTVLTVISPKPTAAYDYHSCYLDNGYSGLTFDWPAFAKMQADIQAGKVQAVIVRNETRIGRNCLDVSTRKWIKTLKAKGIAFVATDHPDEKIELDFKRLLVAASKEEKIAAKI